jgi:hypothetical protein
MTTNDDQDPLDDQTNFGLIMPFVLCASQGGPLEDVAFTIGFELGQIDQELEFCETLYAEPRDRYVHTEGLVQLDLIAMRRGYVLEDGLRDESGEWAFVHFRRIRNDEDE